MKQRGEATVWSIEVLIEETSEETAVEAVLEVDARRIAGWGRARRNPADPNVPSIGKELAAARALSDLGHKLLEAAAEEVAAFEGHPVTLHQ
jgi:hypothetical protein